MKTDLFCDAQVDLIRLMKRRGEVSIKEATRELGLATSTLRQHLMSLSSKGLVNSQAKRQGVGRPQKMYFLTDKANQLFKNQNSFVLTRLLRLLTKQGHTNLLDDFFDQLEEELAIRWHSQIVHLPREQKVNAIAELLEQWGYSPIVDENQPGQLIVEFHHCPYSKIVDITRHPCHMEKALLAKLSKTHPKLTKYMPDGDNSCRFVINLSDDLSFF